MAGQEALYKGFSKQHEWKAERKQLQDRFEKMEIQYRESQMRNAQLENQVNFIKGQHKTKLPALAMKERIASLEVTELTLARELDSTRQDYSSMRQAFDDLQKDLLNEKRTKRRLTHLTL